MEKKPNEFYANFVTLLKSQLPQRYYEQEYHNEQIKSMVQHDQFKSVMDKSPGIVYIYNYFDHKFIYFSANCRNIVGYEPEEYLNGGLEFGMSTFIPEHGMIYQKHILPVMLEHIHKFVQSKEIKDVKFTYSFKIRKKDGSTIWTLHQMNNFETDANGVPALAFCVLSDITHLKKDENVDLVVSKKNSKGKYDVIYMASIPSYDAAIVMSERELEILHLLSEGLSSQEIAEKLNLSVHTVNTHRKRMLSKTGSKNSSEMLHILLNKLEQQ